MPFADVNGAALRYELSGRGPGAIVLVHEMGGTLESMTTPKPRSFAAGVLQRSIRSSSSRVSPGERGSCVTSVLA